MNMQYSRYLLCLRMHPHDFYFFFFFNDPRPPEFSPLPHPAPLPFFAAAAPADDAAAAGAGDRAVAGHGAVGNGESAVVVDGSAARDVARHAGGAGVAVGAVAAHGRDRKSTRLNSSHSQISYAVFCLK